MQTSLVLNERRPWREICFPNGEWVLALALAAELAIFAAIGENFFTLANFFEVVRLSVELGLLALAMTPIMITGGIDLSVGSDHGTRRRGVRRTLARRRLADRRSGGRGACCWAAWRGC